MKTKTLTLAIGVPILIGGWALFRPELLFINSTVNEKFPIDSSSKMETAAKGSFTSYAHETKGTAELVSSSGKNFLRLSSFSTSNGPDVHVYLVKGKDSSGDGVNKNGFLDLGTIKGNIGDQNYQIPSGTNLDDFGAVAIWCKRFNVDFGGASLTKDSKVSALPISPLALHLAGLAGEIKVTGGEFVASGAHVSGMAEIIESNGKRYLRLTGVKASKPGLHVLLVKAETIDSTATVVKSPKVDLGVLKADRVQTIPISKDLDAWLYRSVSLWDAKRQQSVGAAALRSDQERKTSQSLI